MKWRFGAGPADDRPFWQQRGWLMSAAFLAVVLGAAAVTVATGGPGGADDGVRVDSPLTEGLAADGSRPGGCRTDDRGRATPVRPPADVTWRPLNGAQVPVSASAGPLLSAGPVLWCYAHTPMGAVMAAHVIPRQMSGSAWRTVTEQQMVPGAGREIFTAMRSSLPDEPPAAAPSRLAGFSLVSYTAETAVVRLLIRQGTVHGTTDYTVAWDGVDWKLQPLPSGDLHTPVTVAADTRGFVMWRT